MKKGALWNGIIKGKYGKEGSGLLCCKGGVRGGVMKSIKEVGAFG